MFKKKNDGDEYKEEKQDITEQIVETEKTELISEKPKICLIGFKDDVHKELKKKGFNITEASFGSQVKVPNSKIRDIQFCLLNYDFPANIHEYDVFAIDLAEREPINFNPDDNVRKQNKGSKSYYFISKFPENIFNPIPFSTYIFRNELSHITGRKYVLIVFISQKEDFTYHIAAMENDGYSMKSDETYNNYCFANDLCFKENIFGKEVEVVVKGSCLANLLEKCKDSFTYEAIFDHRQVRKEGEWCKDEGFVPLMVNKNNDIISYITTIDDNGVLLVLPQIGDKRKILVPLFEEILPEAVPELFPNSTMFRWIDNKEYWLPNHEKLANKMTALTEEYELNLKKIEDEIAENVSKYRFLHGLLTDTGDELVDDVKKYLEWIGFRDVRKVDCEGKLKEEDLQVDLENGLLIIEVKGIGGTSKDSDCNQISKIRHRRGKERGKYDVFALYIVNHQRYIPPKERKNPPFSEEQIKDARNDERGLLTTWNLYKAYFLMEKGIITKQDVRKALQCYGLIEFKPENTVLLGKLEEVYKNGLVFILNIANTIIHVGDNLIAFQDDDYEKLEIKNIQINNENVLTVNTGEVGFLIDKPVKKNALIYLLN